MVSRDDIQGLATLARLNLSEAELAALQKDISGILDYVGQLKEFAAAAKGAPVAPPLHTVLREDVLRSDEDSLAGREALVRAAFPQSERGYNVVRKILQKDE